MRPSSSTLRTLACGLLLAAPGLANDLGGWLLGQGPVGRTVDGPSQENASFPARVIEPADPFVIGRDNLGFANLSGAITIRGMSGNCYTMATVARMFHQAARYRPDERVSPTFTLEDVAGSLRSSSYPGAGFDVRGFPDLFSMSTAPAGVSDEAWMETWARDQAGLAPAPADTPTALNQGAMTSLYQLVSTIHYMHYVQFQAQHLLGAAVSRETRGGASVPAVTGRAVQRVKDDLAANRLSLLCIFNPRPSVFFGHVVLAYKVVEHPGAGYTDVFVYDSNVQYSGSRWQQEADGDESFLRVFDDGRLELWQQAVSGAERQLSIYSGDDWFEDRDATVLVVLDDLEADDGLRGRLADKVDGAVENAGYLLAVGDLLNSLTRESPQESSLFENLRAFVHQISRMGGPVLAEDASVEDLNAFLAAHGDAAVRAVFPMALPEGVELEGFSLVFDGEGQARLETTLVVRRAGALDALVDAVRASALVGDADLARLVDAARQSFDGQVLRLSTAVELTKGAGSARLGAYGPRARLVGSHLVVGDLTPSPPATGSEHTVEVSEEVANRFVRDRLAEVNVIGRRLEYEYEVLGGDREAYLQVDDVFADSREEAWVLPERLGVRARYHGFAGVMSRRRGVSIESDETVNLWLRMQPTDQRNHLRVEGWIAGSHDVDAGVPGVGLLDGVIRRLFAQALRDLEGQLDSMLEGALAPYLELVGEGPRIRNLEVDTDSVGADVEPFVVNVEESLARCLGFDAEAVPVAITGVQFRDDRVVVRLRND